MMEGAQFPQTSSTYRCSNKACQDERERQTALRIKQKNERDTATRKREEEKLARKNESRKIDQAA
jgi:hypothetical protein